MILLTDRFGGVELQESLFLFIVLFLSLSEWVYLTKSALRDIQCWLNFNTFVPLAPGAGEEHAQVNCQGLSVVWDAWNQMGCMVALIRNRLNLFFDIAGPLNVIHFKCSVLVHVTETF